MEKFKCPICQEDHDIDKNGWIQCNVLGYIELGKFIYEMEKRISGIVENIKTKENTKGNTRSR